MMDYTALADRLGNLSRFLTGQDQTDVREAADAIEELVTYSDFYEELTGKGIKTIRELLDKFPKWIPVTERLPEKRCNFYIVADFGDVCEAYYNSDGVWFSQGNKLKGVTHWMPLPTPPKEES